MGRLIDMTGQRYGRLVVLERAYTDKDNFIRWKCQCDCGNICYVRGYPMRTGATRSCGCLEKENIINFHLNNITHGYSKLPVYKIWKSMRKRCYSVSDKRYHRYGGRGIKICDEWQSAKAFVEWAFANGYRKGLSIDRIDNDGDYCPSNCRWVTITENNRNNSLVRLTMQDAEKIRNLYAGGMKQTEIARMYHTSQGRISNIIHKRSWK